MTALTSADLMALWRSVVDDGYSQPFYDGKAAGTDTQFEAYEQVAEQLARASEMIERNTQAMYVMGWSGQTDDPAGGASSATVTAKVSRTVQFQQPITFVAGQIVVQEVATTWGPNGAVDVLTGRRYVVAETCSFGPGEAGPFDADLVAEQPGYGYNMPEPDSISSIVQIGSGLSNDQASVVPGVANHRLIVRPEPDVVVPELVGQYVAITAGSNVGQVRRCVGYEGPQPVGVGTHGGVAVLAATGIYLVSAVGGVGFEVDEEVMQTVGGVIVAKGIFRKLMTNDLIIIDRTFGDFALAIALVGTLTGSSATIDSVFQSPDMVAEAHNSPPGATGASWRVLDWVTDLGVVVTHAASPTGGKSAMLDELGDERKIYRQPGEDDESYRKRIARVADKISPNAIKRIVNRIFVPGGGTPIIREVGQPNFPGLFFDGDPDSIDPSVAFAFDLDFGTRPADRFKLLMDYLEFRAFFLVGVPPIQFGDYGCAFDAGNSSAFDATPFLAFFDGQQVTAATYYRTAWAAVDDARAAGVGFDLYVEDIGAI